METAAPGSTFIFSSFPLIGLNTQSVIMHNQYSSCCPGKLGCSLHMVHTLLLVSCPFTLFCRHSHSQRCLMGLFIGMTNCWDMSSFFLQWLWNTVLNLVFGWVWGVITARRFFVSWSHLFWVENLQMAGSTSLNDFALAMVASMAQADSTAYVYIEWDLPPKAVGTEVSWHRAQTK